MPKRSTVRTKSLRACIVRSNGEVDGPGEASGRTQVERSAAGAPEAAGRATRAHTAPGARGAKQMSHHGPLQRLLDVGEPEAADRPKKKNNAATKAMSDTKARRRGRAPIEGERADRRCR